MVIVEMFYEKIRFLLYSYNIVHNYYFTKIICIYTIYYIRIRFYVSTYIRVCHIIIIDDEHIIFPTKVITFRPFSRYLCHITIMQCNFLPLKWRVLWLTVIIHTIIVLLLVLIANCIDTDGTWWKLTKR